MIRFEHSRMFKVRDDRPLGVHRLMSLVSEILEQETKSRDIQLKGTEQEVTGLYP